MRWPTLVFLAVAAWLSLHCYYHSAFDIDLLSYAGNAALATTQDPVKIHRMVYDSQPLMPHQLGTDADNAQARMLRRRAADPYESAMYLPYFSVKPLYILAMDLAHAGGADVITSSRVVSSLCFFGIAVGVWLYARSWLAIFMLILPEVLYLGQANEPDGMSTMLLLLALWAIFLKNVNMGVLPLILAVWARPDNAVLCLMVLVCLSFFGRVELPKTIALIGLTLASVIVISHFGYGWRSLYFHTFLGGNPGEVAHFAAADYLRALAHGGRDVLHSSLPIYGILWAVGLICGRDPELRTILTVVALSSLIHFVIFPNYEPRYYGLFFVVTSATAIRLISRELAPKVLAAAP